MGTMVVRRLALAVANLCCRLASGCPRGLGDNATSIIDATRRARIETIERGAVMLSGPKGTEESSVAPCSICGCIETSFGLPGTTEKFCWGCSADLATILVLTDEIDSATLAGTRTDELISELSDISSRMLGRSQLADLGSD
jgi:hypothetical protein